MIGRNFSRIATEPPHPPYTEPTVIAANLSRKELDEDLIKDFSSFNRLTKFVGLCNRWRERALLQVGPTREERIKLKAATKGPKAQAENCSLSLKDVRGAHKMIFKIHQAHAFAEELKYLENAKELPSKNWMTSLAPFTDERGLIRVGGRIKNANVSDDRKRPVILRKSHLVDIMI